MAPTELLDLVSDIVSAHVSNNTVATSDLPNIIKSVHDALTGLGKVEQSAEKAPEPAVSVRSSIKPDMITCLDCGRKSKMLKRHLANEHGMSPTDYRAKWNLPRDYPMVAPNYAEKRRVLAKQIGLGRKPAAPVVETPTVAKRKNASRKKAVPAVDRIEAAT
ncbi:MucR family transcriptional regulator [Novosphingobium cyanobacteriorum]|uniref:MucR family transcriptional regulator n=1 Tax=Novosphingobium cyanobacteriorum TaxID=3024215 RepID=A0ABT6CS77_9SPHN|nr:MucR family transcriptional regulator [Novosphingobium cyanobacteriorum]MDF8335552.1 MucR family transcriptional regulator [Novosphingobium cyanobacteriorum]